jgi:hypothetical protein
MEESKEQKPISGVDEKGQIGSDNVESGSKLNKLNKIEVSLGYKITAEIEKKKRETTIARQNIFMGTFERTLGSVGATCEKTSVPRDTYYWWMNNDKEFKARVDAYWKKKLEDVEQLANNEMLKGNPSLIKHFLDRRHPDYKPHVVNEVITSGKSFKQITDEENERRKQIQSGLESGSDRNVAEDKGQARTDGAVQTEQGTGVLLEQKEEAQPDSESKAEGNK